MKALTKRVQRVVGDEQGAVLVQVAIAMLVLTAMATFVVDHGMLWVSRGQAQNAADAGALSGATSLAYDELTNPSASKAMAHSSAMGAALANKVWTAAPTVDVKFECPAWVGGTSCVRVDVYRNGELGSTPLPTIFGKLLKISSQGVRATATAVGAAANSTNRLRPWMIPDKWTEITPPSDEFNGADVYSPPGFTVPGDVGTVVTLYPGTGGAIVPSNYFKVNLGGTGTANYKDKIVKGSGFSVGIGDTLESFPGGPTVPTNDAVDELIASDPGATWNGTAVVGSDYSISPRIVPIALYSPAEYASMGSPSGVFYLHVVNILGFFVQAVDDGRVTGVLVTTAGELKPGGTTGGGFLKKIQLVW